MNRWENDKWHLNVDFEGMAEDLYNISSAFALEILGTRSKNEDKRKSWFNEEKKFKARKKHF